jgi:hypothetical protein
MSDYLLQQAPKFGLASSDTSGLLPTVMGDVNPQYLGAIESFLDANGGKLTSITGIRIYDEYRVGLGVMPTQGFTFFANPINSTQNVLVSGTAYQKNQRDVSFWIDGGKLAKDYNALIWSMQLIVLLPGSRDETYQTSGNNIGLTLDPGFIAGENATDAIKSGNLMRAILESLYLEFFINSATFEHGTGMLFPSNYGPGNFLSLVGSVAAPASDGLISNTCGWAYQMPIMRYLPEQTRFGVRAQFQNPFDSTNSQQFRIIMVLEGIGSGPLTG